jgi:hypothetical protein
VFPTLRHDAERAGEEATVAPAILVAAFLGQVSALDSEGSNVAAPGIALVSNMVVENVLEVVLEVVAVDKLAACE